MFFPNVFLQIFFSKNVFSKIEIEMNISLGIIKFRYIEKV